MFRGDNSKSSSEHILLCSNRLQQTFTGPIIPYYDYLSLLVLMGTLTMQEWSALVSGCPEHWTKSEMLMLYIIMLLFSSMHRPCLIALDPTRLNSSDFGRCGHSAGSCAVEFSWMGSGDVITLKLSSTQLDMGGAPIGAGGHAPHF